jgi:hypothetical protein
MWAVVQGGTEVEQHREGPDGPVPVPSTAQVRGSGTPGAPAPALSEVTVEVVRLLDDTADETSDLVLTGTWPGRDNPAVLAVVR